MNEFYFDLQRFDSYTITAGGDAQTLSSGIHTITVSKTEGGTTTTTSHSITVSGGASISADTDGTLKLSVTSGTVSNLIYSDTSQTNPPAVNLLSGSGTFQTKGRQNVTFGTSSTIFYFNADSGITTGTNTLQVTENTDSSINITVNASASSNNQFRFGTLLYRSQQQISDFQISIDSEGKYSISLIPQTVTSEVSQVVANYNNKYIRPRTGTITVLEDSNSNFYVKALNSNYVFTINDKFNSMPTDTTVTYTMIGDKLIATRGSGDNEEKKIWNGDAITSTTEINMNYLDFDTSTYLSGVHEIENNILNISSSVLTGLSSERTIIVDKNDSESGYSDGTNLLTYGTFVKSSDTACKVEYNSATKTLDSITITDNLTVELDAGFNGKTITVNNTTSFSSTDTVNNLIFANNSGTVSLGSGATGLSLTSGTLLTTTEAQSIASGDYSIYGYNDNNSNYDGITITKGDSVVVGDIDTGETFSSYDTTTSATSNYTMLSAGLLKETNNTYTIYRDISSGGSHTLGSAGDLLIAPDNGTLEIGTTNTLSGVVFDSASNPTSLHAVLDKSDDGYFLKTVSGATGLASWASTISLTSDDKTSISYGLVSAVTDGLTIATKDSNTTFKVTASANTFVVSSGTAEAPTITGATAITLLNGSITVTETPTIKLNGFTNKDLTVTTNSGSGMKVTVTDSTATINAKTNDVFTIGNDTFTVGSDNGMTITVTSSGMTIKAGVGDSFTVGGETYTVNNGDGITFAVGSSGSVSTISDLATTGDSFTRGNTSYSVKGAGFVTGTSPSWSIWSANNSHSLSGGSVAVESLTAPANWLGVVTIDGSVTVPPGTQAGLLTNSDFDNTYGELTYGSNSASLTHGSNDSGTLNSININSGTTQFTLNAEGTNFYNVSIAAPNSTIMVGAANSDSYQVTLDGAGGNTGLVGATSASLISGKLTATSSLTGGVVVDGATVIPGETVTLTTGTNGASISGLSYGEKFTVNNNEYVFTGAGLRNLDQIKRGTKTNSSVSSNTLALASITSNADWLGMLAVSTSGGVEIGDNRNIYDVFLVDDYTNDTQPSKLYGELKTVSGGYSLSTVTNSDAWEDNYTITIDATTVSISSGFEGASIKASQVGAEFKVDSLNDGATEFVVTDTTANTGVTLSGAKAITQTKGLIAVANSSIQSVTVGDYIIANSGNLSLDVSASGGNAATLSSLDEGENFNINSTGYSIIGGLGLRTDNQFFKDSSITSFSSATLSELTTLTDTNEWIYIAAIKDDILTVPPTIDSSANEWLVLDENKTTRYGTLTSVTGGLSLTKSTLDTAWGNDTIQVVDNTLSLSSDFSGKTISGSLSGALFTVSNNSSYSVIDATGGASIGNATDISLSAGTISLNSANQTISGGDSIISGNGTDIKVTVTDDKATISALATGDSFKVEGVTYTLLSNGRLQRDSDNSIWNGSTIKTDDSGSIAVASLGSNNWNGAISTDSNGNLTIDSAATAVLETISSATAFIVNGDAPTSIYGSFTKDSDTYKLSTSGINTGVTLPAVTITEDVSKVNFTKDLVNVPITAGSTTFTATKAASGYTVNYDSSELSVDDASAIDLTTGTLAIKNSTQLVTANNQSVQAVSDAVNVTYDSNGVTVDGITTAGESVKINDNTYTLATDTTGDGITVNINNGTTTIKDITVGDKFKIDDETFLYTSAGLTKTEANSDRISYVLKAIHPASGELTLDKLQSVDEDTWLGIYLADSGNVTISSDITHSVVLVDSVTDPTINYGQVKLSDGTYTLQKYSDNDEALAAIADQIQNPTSIIVETGITAVIDSVFSSATTLIPVKANNATSINVTDSSGNSYVVGGTVDKFIPSTMTFTPAENDEFTVDGTTYLMTVAGLTKGNKIWTKANVTDYVLPDDDAWSAIVKLTTDNILDITKISPEEGSNIVVDNNSSTRWATLDYTAATDTTPATYSLKYIDSDKLAAVQLADGTATFTVNYITTITTGNGTYTINDNDYTGSGLVVATTASTSTLQDGTVTLDSTTQAVTATNGGSISVTSGEITATASNGTWDTLNNLTEGDIFKIGDNTYKVYGSNTLAKLNSSGEPEKIYNSYITNGKLDYSKIVGDDYSAVIQLNSDDQLDLTKKLSVTSAIVVGQEDGTIDPTVRVAQIDYSETDDAYNLSETTDGVISTLTGVLLGTAVKSFNTTLETTVITSGIDTFTVNGNDFAALNALTITTASSNGAFLTNGKVTVAEGATVTTRYTDTSNHDTTITSTTGTLTVIADSTKNTVTISDMDAGDVFNVGTNSYTMTSVGLTNGTKLNYNALKNNGITTAEFDLTDDAWKNILSTDSGVLTITNAVGSNVFVADVDTTNPSSAVKYGTITKSADDGIYTLTQADGNDTALEGIILTGVKVTFPTTCTNTNITAKGATFKVTASEPFTIDAASTTLGMSDEVTAVELTSGTLQATNGIPITASGNVITTTSGTMTVGIDDTGVFVGGLNEDETFTVGNTSYKKTAAGLLDVTNQKLRSAVTDTYYIGSSFDRIIEAPNGALDLSNEKQSAEVYDSISAPTTHMASLTVSGGKLTLNEVDGGISTITLAKDATLTVNFAATVNGSGTTTVNSVAYDGTDLVIDATATSSTLQSGTVTIDSGESVQATKDSTALAVTSGSITATAADGKFTNIASLASGDIFIFNGKTYTQTAIGLVSSDNKLNGDISTEVTVANLSGTAWQTIYQATSGALTINSSTGSDVVVVDITDDKAQSKRYGTLTKSGATYTLAQESTDSQLASITLDGVKASLPTTCANTTITANAATFTVTASELFTVNATSDIPTLSNVTAVELTSGTIQALNNIPITVGENVITTTSGTMTVGIDSTGVFVGNLNEDETFTVDGTSYKKTEAGLLDVTNQKLRAAVTDTYYLGSSFDRIIEAPSGALDLSSETQSAEVYDSISNPATHMASLTVSGGKLTLNEVDGGISTITLAENATLTVDFAATVNSSGNTTVNSVSYNGTNLVIDATATSSTLQSGTVTIDSGGSVQATKDSIALAVTDGSITATAAEGRFTNIASLASGDIFTFNSKTYTQTAIGLVSSDNKINESVSTEVTVANLSGTAWQDIHQATSGALTINTSTGSDVLVVDITDDKSQSKRYGTLNKSGGTYTLTQADTDSQLASITLDGIKASLPTTCANTTITANDATFTVTATELFTVDATSDIPVLSNVTAITLNSGTIQALNNIPITVGDNVITTTSGTMTVGVDSTGVFIGGLNEDETFTVDGTSYKMTAAGLLDVTNQKLRAAVTDTYYLGTSFNKIIEAPSGALDLSNETTSAEVYDSISNPATHMATLTVSGGKLTLNEVDGGISTITLAENATLTVDFAATVNSSGTTTVNSNTYAGTTNLVIDATATSSTLRSGTVTIDNGNSVQATKDSTPLAVTSGSITATAANGYFTNIASLASDDIFTFNSKTYTQTAIGLVSSDNKINESVSTAVTVANLSGTAWQDIHQATSGALTINTSTGSDVLVVDITNDKSQSKRYGTLTKSGVTYTLAQADTDSQLASITLDGVKASLPTTCANTTITANAATFTVTASELFTVDATTDIPVLSKVTAITLNSGTIQALNNVPITVGENVITTTSGTMTVGIDSTGVFVGGLNEDETFTVDGTSYKMTAAGLLDVTNQKLRAAVTDTYYLGTSFNKIIEAPSGALDLSNETTSAEVYDSISNPATHMATLTVSGGKLTLNEVDGGISTITLAENATLTVDFAATVNSSGTTTVNSNTYAGTTNLVIDATATSSTLQSGTVTIDNGNSVQATKDSTPLAVTSGSIDATAANGYFTNIASLASSDIFTFNSKTYTQTAIGLVSSDNKINEDVSTAVTVANLSGTAWQDIHQATNGALTINTSTGSNVLVVDITNDKSQCKRYGTLTKSGVTYTLAQESTDSQLASITLDGVKASLPTTCANTTITANEATFTVTASELFTVDATADIPTLSKVTAITLNSGTIQALNNIPITVGENVITTTSGTMTVGIDSTGVFVGGLNEDETFTVDGTSYKMTAAGLLDVTNQKLRAAVTDTYYLGTSFDRIIETDGSTLDLSNETSSAEVYDSITAPTTHMASLKVSGGKLTLNEVDGGISTITLAENATLTVDFAATVNASGTTTVNNNTYAGTTNLVIDATATSSTLQSGTLTIDSGESVQATKDSTPLAVTSGSINATATKGVFTTLTNVDAGDRFSFNDNSYIQSTLGLIKDSTISSELVTSTINISDLDSAKWLDFIAPSGGVLNLTNATVNALVLDSATAPTTKLADLTISNSRFNLKGANNPTSIEAVILPENSNINVDFATQVYAPAGSVTVNSTTFDASSEVIIDSDGSTATLYEGTVNLDTTKPTVNVTNDSSTFKVLRGSLTVTVFDGLLVAVGELDTKDSFSFNDVTYTKTAIGLMKDDLISENLAGSTIELADIDTATWSNIIVPLNQTLDLTSATNALVCDDATNPTVKFATFTNSDGVLTLADDGDAADYIKSVDIATGTTLTVDFATKVNAPSGSVIVNSKSYNGTSELVIQSDGTTSTLTSGTVTLNTGDSVSTTNGNTISVSDGDGLTVTVGNNVTIDGINIGDAFKVDDNSYKVTESGLINTSGKFWTGSDFSDGLTVDALNLATNWTGIVVAKDGVLSVDSSTLANDETSTVVDDLSNPTITYGKLTKADDVYTLTKDADNTLSSIKVDSVKIDIDNNLAGVPLTVTTPDGIKTSLNVTASAKFSNFTVDATGNNPTVKDVNAIEISAGKIELFDGQTITLAEDAQEVAIFAGNGTFNVGNETFTIADLGDNTLVEFDFDTDGNANSVIGFNKDSTVTIDGTTYTAPENNAILHYTEEDNWYFDGFAYDYYTVTVDTNGNVLVMPGVKFSDVISSGKTLSDDGTIKFAADYTKTPVTIVNQGKVALNINDADDNTLAENLSKHKNVTFNADGVETEDLTAVAGATFKLQDTKSLTAGDTKVTANDNDCEIGVGEDGTSISADKDATITAPADIALTLNAGDYNVNGADFTGSGTTTATTTADGVELNLANSDSIIYDSMTLSSAGTATIDNADGVTLSGGAKVANATNRALTVDGTAYLDDKTINTAKATEVTTTSAGVKVNRRNVKVSGDTDGYTVNIANLDIIGLENIGNSEGVTVDGLKNATIKTDKSGSLTAGNKTFIYSNDSVTYGLDNGSIVSISDAEQIIGDFSDKVSVNGDGIKLTGSTEVTLSANKNGVTKLELSDEGTYKVNNKTYEIEDEGGFAFGMSGGAVTGVESVENGSLIISQNESGFGVNDGIVTLTNNNNPVTLGIVDSNIVSVSGVDGTINGLENATIYGLSNAVINNKPLIISGSDEYNAIVADGVVNSIGGITDGAIISSAPNVTVTTAENGTFTFDSTEYKVNDTLDASVDFTTDKNSHVIEINNFAGAVSGVLEGVQSLNGKDFSISGAGEVSVTSDGDNITGIIGITDGTEINGDVADLHYVLPEGKVTVNGIAYELEGDDNGALFVSNDGRALTGLDKDATLSVGAAGNYTINGTPFTVEAGDAFTVNRDGAYVIDPKNPPISEKTESSDILARGENPVYVRPTATGNQTVDLTGDSNLALIDSANANVSVQAGAGNDSVVVRHDAAVDVNLDENGSTLIIPTAGKVTLENYNGDNAKVQTFDYSDVSGAIKSNEIKFGDGVMTMGDAIVTYDTAATDTGSTTGKLINAHGKELAVGFTHQNGGLLDKSTSNESYLMKGNYAENTFDTQKSGGSSILTGSGNDTILAGAGDYIDAGGGYNQIYLTDKKMRNSVPEGATIVMNEGAYDTVSNFAGGFSGDDDKILIKNLSELGFGYGAGDLVMSAGSGQITFDNLSGNDHYELKLTDGTNEYKAAVAKAESVMAVDNSNEAEIFYGNENGISFSEYTGAVEVNLNENAGSLNGSAVQYYGLNKVTGGAGDTSLIGAANTPNTLTAGTGNGSIWSNSGRDLMVGNTDAGKSGTTTFFYMPGDGRDTITNFDFMSGTTDINADKIQLDDTSGVTDVFLNGDDVMIGINNGADDYLRLVDAKGKTFRFNDDLIAKVDTNVEFDGFTNCYVGSGSPSTLTVGEGMGDVAIWLSDDSLEYHGIWYDGNFAVLDASAATGRNILAGNEMNNLIIGGADENSIWGGYASSNDTLVGGSGQNTFFFALENGHDVIQNAHDGDLISLEDIYLDNIARADITGGGAVIELTDGSRLEVQSSAAIDYRLQDGTTYTADRSTGEWVQK